MTTSKISEFLELKVEDLKEELRADKWLKMQLPQFSRETIQEFIENGHVLLNSKPLKKKDLLKNSDQVTLSIPQILPMELKPQPIDFSILYEDDSILVINKPKGLVVHPGAGNPENTLVNGLLYHIDDFQVETGDFRPGIVHRLDKDTSGVMIVAKTKEAHFKLAESFAKREVKKIYIALTIGKPIDLVCTLPIKRHAHKRQEMCCDPAGKPAETHFEIIDYSSPYCLVKAKPITGRTHQIRVHLKHLQAPIFSDPIYGYMKKEEEKELLMLHAYEINFEHPITKKQMHFQAPLPESMLSLIQKKLKKDFTF